ncbi:MAG: hypothetical protein D6712_13980, partial [Chloroflexi bacterium]
THYKCDEGAGTTCYDSSGNGRHGTLVNITESSFHVTDNTIFSYQNNYGYSEGTGGALVPRDESNPTHDVLGNTLQYSGRVKYNANLVQSNCATFDGVNDYAITSPNSVTDWFDGIKISARIKTTDATTGYANAIVSKSPSGTSAYFGYTLYISDGKLYASRGDGTSFQIQSSSFIVNDGYWHDVSIQFINGNFVFTVDGQSETYTDILLNQGAPQAAGLEVNIGGFDAYTPAAFNGEICDVKIEDQNGNIIAWWPLAEGAGSVLYDVSSNGLHATMYNTSEASVWVNTQDYLHYNIDKGFSLYTHATNNDLRIPYNANGQPLSITPPTGYTLASEHPAGNWHNNAETKIQMMAGDANLAAGTFWMDSAGTLQARSYNDIVGIWNNEN